MNNNSISDTENEEILTAEEAGSDEELTVEVASEIRAGWSIIFCSCYLN